MQVSHYSPLLSQQFLFNATDKTEPKDLLIEFDDWSIANEAVVGYRHRLNQQVCQDSCQSQKHPRPSLVLCDGAGSASVSDIGSQALSSGLSRLLISMEPMLNQWLDDPTFEAAKADELLSNIISRHSKGILKDLATKHRRPMKDFRSTVLLCVVGKWQTYWCQVGDGYLLRRTSDKLGNVWKLISPPEKGEYANHTCFVDDKLTLSQIQHGLLPSHETTSLVAMSDGAGERLVCQSSGKVGDMVEWIYSEVTANPAAIKSLSGFLSDPNVWNSTTGDDKSLAILAH